MSVTLILRGIARCNGWYQVSYAGRRAWVSLSYISLTEPTPTPSPAPTTTPTRTATGPKPKFSAICNLLDGETGVSYGICLDRMAAGVVWGVPVTRWYVGDSAYLEETTLDGDVVDWTAMPYAAPGWHTIQIYDPPGGDYEGWSDPLSFLVIE